MQYKQKRQYITLNQEGFITSSCDSIISLHDWQHSMVSEFINLFSGIFIDLKEALKHQKMLTLKAINKPATTLPGIYDFIFTTKKNEINPSQDLIEWWIIERTDYYEDIRQFQQVKQDKIIAGEHNGIGEPK